MKRAFMGMMALLLLGASIVGGQERRWPLDLYYSTTWHGATVGIRAVNGMDSVLVYPSYIKSTNGTSYVQVNPTYVQAYGTRPTFLLGAIGVTSQGRVFIADANATGRLDFSSNLYYDGAAWQRDDVAQNSMLFSMTGGELRCRIGTAGANPATLSEAFFLSNAGYAGFGTMTPGARVQISEKANANVRLVINNAATGNLSSDGFGMTVDTFGDAYLDQKEAHDLILRTTGTERVRTLSGGKTGFLTPTPSHPLTVGDVAGLAVKGQDASAATDSSLIITIASGEPTVTFNASDGDQYTQSINTSDQAVFDGASGGYSFAGGIYTTGPDAGLVMFNRATNAISAQWYSPTAGVTYLYSHAAGAVRVVIDNNSNVGIGTTSFGASAVNELAIARGVAPTTNIVGIQIYADSTGHTGKALGHVRDENGNITTWTPHGFDLYTPPVDQDYPWSFYQRNDYLGLEMEVDMFALAQEVEKLSGRQLVYRRMIPKRDWKADQEVLVQATALPVEAWSAWEQGRDEFVADLLKEAKEEEKEALRVAGEESYAKYFPPPYDAKPEPYVATKPAPWMQERGVK